MLTFVFVHSLTQCPVDTEVGLEMLREPGRQVPVSPELTARANTDDKQGRKERC